MKIGVLTGGGDCPGLNAVIRAIVRKGTFHYGDQFVGFLEGWRGVQDNKAEVLDLAKVSGILPRGGTILRTSRTNPAKREGGLQRCMDNLKRHGCDALIAIGGDDTMSVAHKLSELGVKVVSVPKTIDNDLSGTDFCFGFDTAVEIATEAIDRLHTTAEAHNRVIVVEVMGRDSGWIAMYSGVAGGADVILIPEKPFELEDVAEAIKLRHSRGRYFSIVVVAEGAKVCRAQQRQRYARRVEGRVRSRAAGRHWKPFWQKRLRSALASRLVQWCSVTCNVADRQRLSIECWERATDRARSTWYIAATSGRWRLCAEMKLWLFRSRKHCRKTARWIRRSLM